MIKRRKAPTPDDFERAPVTLFQLVDERKQSRAWNAEHFGPIEAFTCDDCAFAPRCTLAFDGYNQNGDCLYSK